VTGFADPQMLARIDALGGHGVQIAWLTTWHAGAVRLLAPAIVLTQVQTVIPDTTDGRSYASHPNVD
jgi:hypothetical protein